MEHFSIWLLIFIVFSAGFGWGKWYAERSIRIERSAIERGRVSLSMPMDKDNATATMKLLTDFIEKVEMKNNK